MRASARGWWSCAEPADGGEAGYEEVLAAPQGVEAVNAVHPAWGRPRHREVCPLSCSATSGSFSLPRPMKLPELTQFALQELDVVDRAGAEGDVVQAAVLAVVGERRRREWFAVGGAPPDDPADVDVAEDFQPGRPGAHPADVGSQRRAQSAGVVGVVEVVDPVRVVAERRVLACRRQRQWRAA